MTRTNVNIVRGVPAAHYPGGSFPCFILKPRGIAKFKAVRGAGTKWIRCLAYVVLCIAKLNAFVLRGVKFRYQFMVSNYSIHLQTITGEITSIINALKSVLLSPLNWVSDSFRLFDDKNADSGFSHFHFYYFSGFPACAMPEPRPPDSRESMGGVFYYDIPTLEWNIFIIKPDKSE
jgi:hypothetical protein